MATLSRLSHLKLPVIGAPLFIVSNPDLVIAQCKAGIIGSFPALNARPQAELKEWLKRITSELAEHNDKYPDAPAAPYAVNQIVHRSNDRLMDDMAVCAEFAVPLVISSLGARSEVNEAVHAWGGIVFHDVVNNKFARKAVAKGADGLVAVAAGAGGHAGTTSPFALVSEIREWFGGPLALSGAIATGSGVAAAVACGADFAYIGSAFIATDEANANARYKAALVHASSADIVNSDLFTGVHGNYLRGSIAAAGLDPDALPKGDVRNMNFGTGGSGGSGAKAWKDIWGCGQGVGAVKEVAPCARVVDRFAAEYAAAKARLTDEKPRADEVQ